MCGHIRGRAVARVDSSQSWRSSRSPPRARCSLIRRRRSKRSPMSSGSTARRSIVRSGWAASASRRWQRDNDQTSPRRPEMDRHRGVVRHQRPADRCAARLTGYSLSAVWRHVRRHSIESRATEPRPRIGIQSACTNFTPLRAQCARRGQILLADGLLTPPSTRDAIVATIHSLVIYRLAF